MNDERKNPRPPPPAPRPSSVHLIYDVPGWAYWRRAEAIKRYAPADMTVTTTAYRDMRAGAAVRQDLYAELAGCDLVFLMAYGACREIRAGIGPGPVLACGYNCGVGYRREKLNELLEHSDHVIVNNRANWEACGRPERTTWISNGVDLEVFHVLIPPAWRRPRVLSIGSAYHQRHNDDLKGFRDILEPIRPELEQAGIACDFRVVDSVRGPKMDTAEMVRWYNTGTIYAVSSRHEGTPNPALEAAACGCVVVSTAVGNMPELIVSGQNGLIVDRTPEAFLAGILAAKDRHAEMSAAMQEAIGPWNWRERAGQYYDLFRRLLEEKRKAESGSLTFSLGRPSGPLEVCQAVPPALPPR